MSRELFKWSLLKKTDKGRLWFRDLSRWNYENMIIFYLKAAVYGISGRLCASFQSVHWHLLWNSAVNLKKQTFKGKSIGNLHMLFSSSGLSLRRRWLPCTAVLGSCRRTFPGSVPRVAASVQWPGESLRSQVQNQGLGPCGRASS